MNGGVLSSANAGCMKNNNVTRMYYTAWTTAGVFNPEACSAMLNAHNAGITPGSVFYPCLNCSTSIYD